MIDHSLLVGIKHVITDEEETTETRKEKECHLAVIDLLTSYDFKKTRETMAKIVLH